MANKTERQKAVANCLLDNPQASPVEISEALCLTDRATRYIIGVMTENGMITRTRNTVDGRCHRLVLSNWYADELLNGPAPEATDGDPLRQLTARAVAPRSHRVGGNIPPAENNHRRFHDCPAP